MKFRSIAVVLLLACQAATLLGQTPVSRTTFGSGLSSKAACAGFQPYPCNVRTDLGNPTLVLPNVGNGTYGGANSTYIDPMTGERGVRVTDPTLLPTTCSLGNCSFGGDPGGSAKIIFMDKSDSYFVTSDTGSDMEFWSFNPSTMQASWLQNSRNGNCRGGDTASSPSFSHNTAGLMYCIEGGTALNNHGDSKHLDLYQINLTQNPYVETLIADLGQAGSACSPPGVTYDGNLSWVDPVLFTPDDNTFITSLSLTSCLTHPSCGQDTAQYVIAWNRSANSCHWFQTDTGMTDTGAITGVVDTYTVHETGLAGNGTVVVSRASTGCTTAGGGPGCYCTSGTGCVGNYTTNGTTASYGKYQWTPGSANIVASTLSKGGHWAAGYSHYINDPTCPFDQSIHYMPLGNTTDACPGTGTPYRCISDCSGPVVPQDPWDGHPSYLNANANDTEPIIGSFYAAAAGLNPGQAWNNEVLGFVPGTLGSPVNPYRFGRTYGTRDDSQSLFDSAYLIGSVSLDGRFFELSTDWGGQFCNTSSNGSCLPCSYLNSAIAGSVSVSISAGVATVSFTGNGYTLQNGNSVALAGWSGGTSGSINGTTHYIANCSNCTGASGAASFTFTTSATGTFTGGTVTPNENCRGDVVILELK